MSEDWLGSEGEHLNLTDGRVGRKYPVGGTSCQSLDRGRGRAESCWSWGWCGDEVGWLWGPGDDIISICFFPSVRDILQGAEGTTQIHSGGTLPGTRQFTTGSVLIFGLASGTI